ncbi:MAG: glycosyltransferase [Desulfobacula sp.]|uniref:glycosyltransferase n=1 Tax=Desulfobacula sp. TaxID=2593537 RepID=UPI0025B9C847|nr:nucleotide disphospho-sugar-binding domain-containing protein [Desulfobacula sp.]MCD4719065.1 glycosyltransferase [Desulfobacula sp.]
MRIVLATCGSRGDVQPMIALSLALKAAGHDVLLVGPPEKALWARQLGCPYKKFGTDVTTFLNNMKDAISLRTNIASVFFVRQELHSQFKVLPKIIETADLVIGSSLMFALSSIAQAMNIKYRYVAFTPQLFPSNNHPFLTIKTQTLPQWCNGMSWKIASLLDKFNLTFLINRYRKKLGLGPVDNAWDHILGEHPIVACDKEVAKVPIDVKTMFVQTGYLHLDLPAAAQPNLDRFLKKGERPIYAGFGSMPPKDQAKNIPLLVAAARRVGKRIIITKFWEKSSEYQSANDVFFIKNYPHLMLFPQTDAVIHHGGAGTTATTAISGVPQVIIPHILDQYFHGQKIYSSNLGPKPIWRSKLTVGKLSAALKECLSNPKIKQTAKKIKKSIDRDKSLQLTVKTIEQSF